MYNTKIQYKSKNNLEISFNISYDIEFIEIYYKYNLIKRLDFKKRSFLKELIRQNKICLINFNTYIIPDKSKIEVIGFSKKKSIHKLFDFAIKNPKIPKIRIKETDLNPIIFTSLGRSGTTFLMNLLANVDEIVSDKTYPLENKYASKLFQSIQFYDANYIDNVKNNIEGKFLGFSKKYKKSNPKYFIEKNMSPMYIIDHIYPNSKKIFLVRNFKDTIQSSLNFNKKRGNHRFGREYVNDDMNYIKFKAKQAVKWIYEPYLENKHNSLLVKYEDLMKNTKSELIRILDYLEIHHHDSKLNQIINETRMDSESYTFHKTKSEFKNDFMSAEIINKINEEFSFLINEFNY